MEGATGKRKKAGKGTPAEVECIYGGHVVLCNTTAKAVGTCVKLIVGAACDFETGNKAVHHR